MHIHIHVYPMSSEYFQTGNSWKWLGTSNICNIIRDIRVRTLKETWHLTGPVSEMNIWIYWSESNSCNLFNIVLNKNWKYLVVWTIKLSFTGLLLGWCSSYSVVSPFFHTDTTLQDQTLLTLIENIKVGYIPFTLSIN